ncbi:MAG: hypothetical protein N2B03_02570, partial [Boseongicola sp.]
PIIAHLSIRNSVDSFGKWDSLKSLTLNTDFSIMDVIAWKLVGAALAVHVFAHILVTFTRPEELP